MSEQSNPAPTAEQPQVEYRDISGHPGYRVGDDGSVWSCRIGGYRARPGPVWRRMRPKLLQAGYLAIELQVDCRKKNYRVHRLVLEAFVGPRPEGKEACHRNDVKTDNRLTNLRWAGRDVNVIEAILNGRPGRWVVTIERALEIRRLLAQGGQTQRAIARIVGVSETTVSHIKLGHYRSLKEWDERHRLDQ